METGEISLLSMVGGALAKGISCWSCRLARLRRYRMGSLADGTAGRHPARVHVRVRARDPPHRDPEAKDQPPMTVFRSFFNACRRRGRPGATPHSPLFPA